MVVVTDEQLEALGSTPALRLVLPNYPRLERFVGAEPRPDLAADPRLKLIYVGSLSRGRGCALMLDVMERLGPDEAVLYLGGTFASPDMEEETRGRLAAGLDDRVKLLGRIATGRAAAPTSRPPTWSGCRRCPPRSTAPTIPTKLLEGMAMGLAALVTNLPGRGELVRLEACGLAVGARRRRPPARPATPARRPPGARRDGQRGRRAVERRFCWEVVAGDLVDFYGSLCAGLA